MPGRIGTSSRACARLLTSYPMRAVLPAVVCVLPPQALGIEDADTAQQHQQAAAAAAVQLPWLGPILQTALVPMQVRPPSISQLGGAQTSVLCWQEEETGRLFVCLSVCLFDPRLECEQQRQQARTLFHSVTRFVCCGDAGSHHRP